MRILPVVPTSRRRLDAPYPGALRFGAPFDFRFVDSLPRSGSLRFYPLDGVFRPFDARRTPPVDLTPVSPLLINTSLLAFNRRRRPIRPRSTIVSIVGTTRFKRRKNRGKIVSSASWRWKNRRLVVIIKERRLLVGRVGSFFALAVSKNDATRRSVEPSSARRRNERLKKIRD